MQLPFLLSKCNQVYTGKYSVFFPPRELVLMINITPSRNSYLEHILRVLIARINRSKNPILMSSSKNQSCGMKWQFKLGRLLFFLLLKLSPAETWWCSWHPHCLLKYGRTHVISNGTWDSCYLTTLLPHFLLFSPGILNCTTAQTLEQKSSFWWHTPRRLISNCKMTTELLCTSQGGFSLGNHMHKCQG